MGLNIGFYKLASNVSYNVPHLRRDPTLDSSYLRSGRVLSEYSSLILHLTTKGRMPRSVDAMLYDGVLL